MKVAIVRGKFLNRYEMQLFEAMPKRYDITAFGSLTPYHDTFTFPVVKLPSPMDFSRLAGFRFAQPILNRLFIDAHYLWGLENALKNYDLVHSAETYYHYTQQALNAKKKGHVKKVIATVLENIPFNNEGIWGRKAFKERARRELDHIIALTQKTKDALIQEGCDPKKITVIGHAIDTKRFTPQKPTKKKELTVLFVGRLEVEKGILEVLEAAKVLLKEYKVKFVIVGDGSLRNNIPNYVIHTTASYDDMPSIYQNADIYVAPSKPTPTWDEQYNTTLMEAQASGLPIVTTKTGGIPENVGDAAILVKPGDVGEITRAIRSFIVDPKLRDRYSKKARARAMAIHDSKKVAARMAALYDYVMSKK